MVLIMFVQVNGTNALESLKSLYHSAGVLRHWRAVRYCSSLLNHTVDSISPFITTVLVNGKQVNGEQCSSSVKITCWFCCYQKDTRLFLLVKT